MRDQVHARDAVSVGISSRNDGIQVRTIRFWSHKPPAVDFPILRRAVFFSWPSVTPLKTTP